VTALSFAATLDRVERFRGRHPAAAYLGLVPGERSSGEQQRRGPIIKRGHGPTLKLLLDRDPIRGAALASQPALSRYGVRRGALYRMGEVLFEQMLACHARRLRRVGTSRSISTSPTTRPTAPSN
jgi:hypothetical protein